MMKCPINLEETFADRYRIEKEAGWQYRGTGEDVAWYYQMPISGRVGHFYVHGRGELGIAVDKRGSRLKRLLKHDWAKVAQDGDDGVNVVFPLEMFDAVAKVFPPRRKRRLSEDHRAKLAAANAPYRFSKNLGSEGRDSDQGRVQKAG